MQIIEGQSNAKKTLLENTPNQTFNKNGHCLNVQAPPKPLLRLLGNYRTDLLSKIACIKKKMLGICISSSFTEYYNSNAHLEKLNISK